MLPAPNISSIYAAAATEPPAFTCLTTMDTQVCEPEGGPYSYNSQNPGCVLRHHLRAEEMSREAGEQQAILVLGAASLGTCCQPQDF